MNILSIIPARGGSKGLPNKNILQVAGHPLLAYSIAAGIQSTSITRVICSTDSEKIAEIALSYGAEVPFLRPEKYAMDHSQDIEVFIHALEWLQKTEQYKPDIIVQLRPTSPIRFINDIETGIDLLRNNSQADSVRGISETLTTPYKMWKIKSNGFLNPLLNLSGEKEPYNLPRQKLPLVYAQNGTLEVIRYKTIIDKKSMTGDNILPLMIDQQYYVDIDTHRSLMLAELIIKETNCIKP
jgi:N-acylneuraminate cytidylyltransferase